VSSIRLLSTKLIQLLLRLGNGTSKLINMIKMSGILEVKL
jgi:hypothetical protein